MNAQVFIFKHIRFFNMYKLKYNLCASKYIALGSLVFNCQINGYKCGRIPLTSKSYATPVVNISKFMKNLLQYGREIWERPIIGKYRFLTINCNSKTGTYHFFEKIEIFLQSLAIWAQVELSGIPPAKHLTLCGPRDSRVGPPAGTFKYLGGTQAPQ